MKPDWTTLGPLLGGAAALIAGTIEAIRRKRKREKAPIESNRQPRAGRKPLQYIDEFEANQKIVAILEKVAEQLAENGRAMTANIQRQELVNQESRLRMEALDKIVERLETIDRCTSKIEERCKETQAKVHEVLLGQVIRSA